MRFDIVTIFPEFFNGPLDYGIVRRAREARLIETQVRDLRAFAHDRHRTVDDRPFGGGAGMVMKPEPIFEAVESLVGDRSLGQKGSGATAAPGAAIVLLSAAGKLFTQEVARRFAKLDHMVLLCGRYEGVDERVAEHLATDEISIGDFVLSGGELAASMILDAVTRLIPGVLGNEDSAVDESFGVMYPHTTGGPDRLSGPKARPTRTDAAGDLPDGSDLTGQFSNRGILDYPHYTRPQSFRGWDVPGVLVGGDHEGVRRWRRQQAFEKTRRNRPDLLEIQRTRQPC
jgi:tRNA (guanine37-N1)-methyltransferase